MSNLMINRVYDAVTKAAHDEIKDIESNASIGSLKIDQKFGTLKELTEILLEGLDIPKKTERDITSEEPVELPPVCYVLTTPEIACLLTGKEGTPTEATEFIREHGFIEGACVYSYMLLRTGRVYFLQDHEDTEVIVCLKAFDFNFINYLK